MPIDTINFEYNLVKESLLFHRYIHGETIRPLLKQLEEFATIDVIGQSVNNQNIHAVTLGKGNLKVLMWSQMHGNESTTTKALFDVFNFLKADSELSQAILKACTIKVIPILNPDGAKAYTRLNANGIDLNRDAQDLSQPESKALRAVFDEFHPDFCFNLHGQRTIFSAGLTNQPATVSFLAPAQDEACTITDNRKRAMELIAIMNSNLQNQIPNQVGIYDDAFNINCVGDTFQSFNIPTLLFEAGHHANDYGREITRTYIFQSLIIALRTIASHALSDIDFKTYFKIPKNEKLFYDIVIRNAMHHDIAIQYQETLIDNKICFIPKVEAIEDLKHCFGHKEYDAKGFQVLSPDKSELNVGNEIDFVIINNEIFSLIL